MMAQRAINRKVHIYFRDAFGALSNGNLNVWQRGRSSDLPNLRHGLAATQALHLPAQLIDKELGFLSWTEGAQKPDQYGDEAEANP
jgi:hypothetical protein